jgi:hypothetical protein
MTENYKDMSLPPSWNEMLTEEAARNTRKREDDYADDAEAGDYCRDIVEAEQTFADKAKTAPRRGGVTNK